MLKAHFYPFPTQCTHMKSRDEILFKGGRAIRLPVLHPKQPAKSCHEHHVYMTLHVIKSVDELLVT